MSDIKNLPKTLPSTGEVPPHTSLRDAEALRDTRWVQVGPVRQNDHGALSGAQHGHSPGNLGLEARQINLITLRESGLTLTAKNRSTVPSLRLVEHSSK